MQKSSSFEDIGINMHAAKSQNNSFSFTKIARGDAHLLGSCGIVP